MKITGSFSKALDSQLMGMMDKVGNKAPVVGNKVMTDSRRFIPRLTGIMDKTGRFVVNRAGQYKVVITFIYSTAYAAKVYHVTGGALPYTYYKNGVKRQAPGGGHKEWIEFTIYLTMDSLQWLIKRNI